MIHEIPTPNQMMIPTKMFTSSCVGVSGEFPRGHGNYISVHNSKHRFVIVNVSGEDLIDAISLGLINQTMEADVYPTGRDDEFIAFVTDSRLPNKAKDALHFYGVPKNCKVAIIRKKFNTRDGYCVCESFSSMLNAIEFIHVSRAVREGHCIQCNSKYTILREEDHNEY